MPIYRFSEAAFRPEIAHGGEGLIEAARVAGQSAHQNVNFIDQVVVPPGRSIGLHRHAESDEEFYIIVSGQGLAFLDGSSKRVAPGDVLANPPGGTHGLINDGLTPLRLVVIDVRLGGTVCCEPVDVVPGKDH